MRAYLNDWSLASVKDVFSNWERIKVFQELVDELSGKCGLEILAPRNLWDIPFSGCDLRTSSTNLPAESKLPSEQFLFLKSIYKRMSPAVEGMPLFSESEDMSNPSSSVGHAASMCVPVLSFTFDGKYITDSIPGWLQTDKATKGEGSVANIYEKKPENYNHFADLSLCRHLDPLSKPLWNCELVGAFLKDVDFVNVDIKSRQGMLIKYGRIVAEMNGWRHNPYISSLNKSEKHLRYIFDSSYHFVDFPVAYLSLDMEGPDLAFELCDKRGHHQGEYSWNGTHKEPKMKHDIRVK